MPAVFSPWTRLTISTDSFIAAGIGLGKDFEKIRYTLNSKNAHSILDNIQTFQIVAMVESNQDPVKFTLPSDNAMYNFIEQIFIKRI